MVGTFDFAPNSHVAEEVAPEAPSATSFNGWEFTARPNVPYRPKFKLTMSGMRWRLTPARDALDVGTEPALNAGRLLNFYKLNQTWDNFVYRHEYLGPITCRFSDPLNIPKALPDSSGLVPDFEVVLVQHNPGF